MDYGWVGYINLRKNGSGLGQIYIKLKKNRSGLGRIYIKLMKDGSGLGRIYQVDEGWIRVGSDIYQVEEE